MQQQELLGKSPNRRKTSDQENNTLKEERENILEKLTGRIFGFLLPSKKVSLRESLEEILEEGEESISPKEAGERAIIRNVLEFNEMDVEDIMIPRADIFAIESDIDIKSLQEKLNEKTYTRIPIYRENLDQISGFIHVKDIAKSFLEERPFEMENMIRKTFFVPESMKISNLLIKMQQSRVHIAIVVDEYGGTQGLVTLEDILEEIVGDIQDEHDQDNGQQEDFKKVGKDSYEVNSRIRIDELMDKTGIDLSIEVENEEEFSTVGGYIYSELGRIPVKGEIVPINGKYEAEILEADARSIDKIHIRKRKPL